VRQYTRLAAGCSIWAAAWLTAGCGEGEPAPSNANPFASSPPPAGPVAPPRAVSSEQLVRGAPPPAGRTPRPPATRGPAAPGGNGTRTPNGTHPGNGTPEAAETGDDPEPAPPNTSEQDNAIAAATRMIQDNPRSAHVAYNNRAVAYYQKGDLPRALADLNKAIGLNPEYAEAYMNRGVVYEQLGQSARAEADYARARQLSQ
jgi:hypothetical protein